jgi:Berberine and berberine like
MFTTTLKLASICLLALGGMPGGCQRSEPDRHEASSQTATPQDLPASAASSVAAPAEPTGPAWQAMAPHADAAVYVNAVGEEMDGCSRQSSDAYGDNYEWLRDLKRKFDPANMFRQNTEPR